MANLESMGNGPTQAKRAPALPYSAHVSFRPHPASCRFALSLLVTCIALTSGGCSYQLGSLFSKSDADLERTASIPVTAHTDRGAEADLVLAKAAAAEVLATGAKDASRPWENPRTGARGSVTPIATAYSQDGFTCRDFLASHISREKETWYQGGACRVHGGRWQIRDIRPLQRT
jgi:surface antigen